MKNNKKSYNKAGITILITITLIFLSITTNATPRTTTRKTLFVDDDGGTEYTNIQDAIDNASDGDTVFVYAGTYLENIDVDKSINLIGENRNTTFIVSAEYGDTVAVFADGVTISGFSIQTTGSVGMWDVDAGIELMSSHNTISWNKFPKEDQCGVSIASSSAIHNAIMNNIIESRLFGIFLSHSSDNTIFKNTIKESDTHFSHFYGICVNASYGNMITENDVTVSDSADGIAVGPENAVNNTISKNMVTYIDGDSEDMFFGIRLSQAPSNKVIKNTIIRLVDHGDYRDEGIALMSSPDCIVTNNEIKGTNKGISIGYGSSWSNNSIIADNVITNCKEGIAAAGSNIKIVKNQLKDNLGGIMIGYGSDNTIKGNELVKNGLGMHIIYASNNMFIENILKENDCALLVIESSNNRIYHNNFINNTGNIFNVSEYGEEMGSNIWDNGYPSGGNYWSDYNGSDNYQGPNQTIPNSDGIGDTPYEIPHTEEQDQYPLFNPFVLGDMNVDGQADFDDIDPFVLALSNPDIYQQTYDILPLMHGDVNQDGTLNFGDIDAFIKLLQSS